MTARYPALRPGVRGFTPGRRASRYKLLALQDLDRRDRPFLPDKKLSWILSVVYYTGEDPWNVPTSLLDEVRELPEAPEGEDFWGYHLIDARCQRCWNRPWTASSTESAKKGQLMTWAKRLLTSERPEDVFD